MLGAGSLKLGAVEKGGPRFESIESICPDRHHTTTTHPQSSFGFELISQLAIEGDIIDISTQPPPFAAFVR